MFMFVATQSTLSNTSLALIQRFRFDFRHLSLAAHAPNASDWLIVHNGSGNGSPLFGNIELNTKVTKHVSEVGGKRHKHTLAHQVLGLSYKFCVISRWAVSPATINCPLMIFFQFRQPQNNSQPGRLRLRLSLHVNGIQRLQSNSRW